MTMTDTAAVTVNAPTSVSLSGFGSDNAGIPVGLLIASISIALVAGIAIVSRRRSEQI